MVARQLQGGDGDRDGPTIGADTASAESTEGSGATSRPTFMVESGLLGRGAQRNAAAGTSRERSTAPIQTWRTGPRPASRVRSESIAAAESPSAQSEQ